MITFKALIHGNESGGAYIEVPCDVEQLFGSKRPKVIAKFNDQISYRGSLVRMKTIHHILLIKKDIRAQLNLDVGDNGPGLKAGGQKLPLHCPASQKN